ncbi:hypothetical protein M0811_09540 [Anaeramoeba ignava]|uniref:Uncharacterized protein n=1 Tax=Anaeramoeba ignava TaxID=1746090 RepID=A0A9Q0LGS4_ANAIG|nr:hypothetical protein M0811_09540 [Anaeramoeba ignava]
MKKHKTIGFFNQSSHFHSNHSNKNLFQFQFGNEKSLFCLECVSETISNPNSLNLERIYAINQIQLFFNFQIENNCFPQLQNDLFPGILFSLTLTEDENYVELCSQFFHFSKNFPNFDQIFSHFQFLLQICKIEKVSGLVSVLASLTNDLDLCISICSNFQTLIQTLISLLSKIRSSISSFANSSENRLISVVSNICFILFKICQSGNCSLVLHYFFELNSELLSFFINLPIQNNIFHVDIIKNCFAFLKFVISENDHFQEVMQQLFLSSTSILPLFKSLWVPKEKQNSQEWISLQISSIQILNTLISNSHTFENDLIIQNEENSNFNLLLLNQIIEKDLITNLFELMSYNFCQKDHLFTSVESAEKTLKIFLLEDSLSLLLEISLAFPSQTIQKFFLGFPTLVKIFHLVYLQKDHFSDQIFSVLIKILSILTHNLIPIPGIDLQIVNFFFDDVISIIGNFFNQNLFVPLCSIWRNLFSILTTSDFDYDLIHKISDTLYNLNNFCVSQFNNQPNLVNFSDFLYSESVLQIISSILESEIAIQDFPFEKNLHNLVYFLFNPSFIKIQTNNQEMEQKMLEFSIYLKVLRQLIEKEKNDFSLSKFHLQEIFRIGIFQVAFSFNQELVIYEENHKEFLFVEGEVEENNSIAEARVEMARFISEIGSNLGIDFEMDLLYQVLKKNVKEFINILCNGHDCLELLNFQLTIINLMYLSSFLSDHIIFNSLEWKLAISRFVIQSLNHISSPSPNQMDRVVYLFLSIISSQDNEKEIWEDFKTNDKNIVSFIISAIKRLVSKLKKMDPFRSPPIHGEVLIFYWKRIKLRYWNQRMIGFWISNENYLHLFDEENGNQSELVELIATNPSGMDILVSLLPKSKYFNPILNLIPKCLKVKNQNLDYQKIENTLLQISKFDSKMDQKEKKKRTKQILKSFAALSKVNKNLKLNSIKFLLVQLKEKKDLTIFLFSCNSLNYMIANNESIIKNVFEKENLNQDFFSLNFFEDLQKKFSAWLIKSLDPLKRRKKNLLFSCLNSILVLFLQMRKFLPDLNILKIEELLSLIQKSNFIGNPKASYSQSVFKALIMHLLNVQLRKQFERNNLFDNADFLSKFSPLVPIIQNYLVYPLQILSREARMNLEIIFDHIPNSNYGSFAFLSHFFLNNLEISTQNYQEKTFQNNYSIIHFLMKSFLVPNNLVSEYVSSKHFDILVNNFEMLVSDFEIKKYDLFWLKEFDSLYQIILIIEKELQKVYQKMFNFEGILDQCKIGNVEFEMKEVKGIESILEKFQQEIILEEFINFSK